MYVWLQVSLKAHTCESVEAAAVSQPSTSDRSGDHAEHASGGAERRPGPGVQAVRPRDGVGSAQEYSPGLATPSTNNQACLDSAQRDATGPHDRADYSVYSSAVDEVQCRAGGTGASASEPPEPPEPLPRQPTDQPSGLPFEGVALSSVAVLDQPSDQRTLRPKVSRVRLRRLVSRLRARRDHTDEYQAAAASCSPTANCPQQGDEGCCSLTECTAETGQQTASAPTVATSTSDEAGQTAGRADPADAAAPDWLTLPELQRLFQQPAPQPPSPPPLSPLLRAIESVARELASVPLYSPPPPEISTGATAAEMTASPGLGRAVEMEVAPTTAAETEPEPTTAAEQVDLDMLLSQLFD